MPPITAALNSAPRTGDGRSFMTTRVQRFGWISRLCLGSSSVGLAWAFVLGLGVDATPSAQAQAYKESTIYTFTDTPDGAGPWAGLIRDKAGSLYGTTHDGGAYGQGTVFEVGVTGKGSVLYSFGGYPDGAHPQAGLSRSGAGSLYGTTTYYGGAGLWGTVFKLDTTGEEAVLYSFSGGIDGGYPVGGLVRDHGNFFGTTVDGGEGSGCYYGGCGTVFEVDATAEETVLHSFTVGTEGQYPVEGLVRDAAGNLYGITYQGGKSTCNNGSGTGCGTVFELDNTGKLTVLHNFTGGKDGAYPDARLIRDARGNLYGTTLEGGTGCKPNGCGTVFKVDATGKETVLHAFTGGVDAGGASSLVRDARGNLYGASGGGAHGQGMVFKLDTTGKETVLYSFTGGADGGLPVGPLVLDKAGTLYGATIYGGVYGCGAFSNGCGTVFKLVP
jgi:uncharacterized repeat protein (TIGR03803 family)